MELGGNTHKDALSLDLVSLNTCSQSCGAITVSKSQHGWAVLASFLVSQGASGLIHVKSFQATPCDQKSSVP